MAENDVTGITRLSVQGFKSIADEMRVEIRPLTILAGANSSGKSSAIQPLLLLKQTLEAVYDPGPVLLDGPNVRFTSADQLLTKLGGRTRAYRLAIGITLGDSQSVKTVFEKREGSPLEVAETTYQIKEDGSTVLVRPGMDERQLVMTLPATMGWLRELVFPDRQDRPRFAAVRSRGFLEVGLASPGSQEPLPIPSYLSNYSTPFAFAILGVVHVPGLRGNPLRTYPTTGPVSYNFPGTFENYLASVVNHWHITKSPLINVLSDMLEELGLTWTIQPRPIDDTQIELLVGRLPRAKRGGDRDLVSVADVGLGVSQILPVLVALLAASPGQLVYVEQPEIHLHPRAQEVLARILLLAAQRGVRVVVETHSALLILAVQSLVAEGKASADLVKLHWFNRGPSGATAVTSAYLDEAGAFGDWPEDFGDIELDLQRRYLVAAGRHQRIGA